MSVTERTRGPSQELVSPPAIATLNSRASDSIPSWTPSAALFGEGHADHRGQRPARHRRHVAETDGQPLAAHGPWVRFGKAKIDPFHKHVDRDEALAGRFNPQQGRIIANSQRNRRMGSRSRTDPIDEGEFGMGVGHNPLGDLKRRGAEDSDSF
jgi:hypothetical protein